MLIRAVSQSILLTLGVGLGVGFATSSPTSADANLKASIKAESLQMAERSYEMISFHLENMSSESVRCEPETWVLEIDGKELTDSGMILMNGISPAGGYNTLRPGASFSFTKGLEIARYFPENKEYSVQWKGAGFTSNVVTFHIDPPVH